MTQCLLAFNSIQRFTEPFALCLPFESALCDYFRAIIATAGTRFLRGCGLYIDCLCLYICVSLQRLQSAAGWVPSEIFWAMDPGGSTEIQMTVSSPPQQNRQRKVPAISRPPSSAMRRVSLLSLFTNKVLCQCVCMNFRINLVGGAERKASKKPMPRTPKGAKRDWKQTGSVSPLHSALWS